MRTRRAVAKYRIARVSAEQARREKLPPEHAEPDESSLPLPQVVRTLELELMAALLDMARHDNGGRRASFGH